MFEERGKTEIGGQEVGKAVTNRVYKNGERRGAALERPRSAQKAKACSTQDYSAFRKFAN